MGRFSSFLLNDDHLSHLVGGLDHPFHQKSRTHGLHSCFKEHEGVSNEDGEIDEEEAEKAIDLAEDVEAELDKLQKQALASKALLSEQMDLSLAAELRNKLRHLNHQLDRAFLSRSDVDKALGSLYGHMTRLKHYSMLPLDPSQPYEARDLLTHIQVDVAATRRALEKNLKPVRDVLEEIGTIDVERSHPHLSLEDRTERPPPENEEERLEDVQTASGCICDPTNKCANSGRGFTWCEVASKENQNGSKCGVLSNFDEKEDHFKETDPTGLSHELIKSRKDHPLTPEEKAEDALEDAEKPQGLHQNVLGEDGAPEREPRHFWDYCVPPKAQVVEDIAHPGRHKTAHSNCHCAWRTDLWERYARDPAYHNQKGDILVEKIPFRDRFAVDAMKSFLKVHGEEANKFLASGELCTTTKMSGGYAVCPVGKDCAADVTNNADGLGTTSWFAGLSSRNWDFCVPPPPQEETTPGEGGEEMHHDEEGNPMPGGPLDSEGAGAGAEGVVQQSLVFALPFVLRATPGAYPGRRRSKRPLANANSPAELGCFLPALHSSATAICRAAPLESHC